jgi:hypothetical protein
MKHKGLDRDGNALPQVFSFTKKAFAWMTVAPTRRSLSASSIGVARSDMENYRAAPKAAEGASRTRGGPPEQALAGIDAPVEKTLAWDIVVSIRVILFEVSTLLRKFRDLTLLYQCRHIEHYWQQATESLPTRLLM